MYAFLTMLMVLGLIHLFEIMENVARYYGISAFYLSHQRVEKVSRSIESDT